MPYVEIGREITRGTICRDRWRADLVVACSDRIPVGRAEPLALRVRWRTSEGGENASPPEDAQPVTLRLRKASDSSPGDARFDRADGPEQLAFRGDTDELRSIVGIAATAGEEPDVFLDVSVDGEVRESLPLSVGEPVGGVRIRPGRGGGPPPDLVPPGRPVPLRATATPAEGGTFRWFVIGEPWLRLDGPTNEPSVAVVGREGGSGARAVCVVHTAGEGAPARMAAHRLGIREGAVMVDPASLAHPPEPAVVAAGWSVPTARVGSPTELIAIVEGGVVGQRVTFEIGAATGLGTIPLERLDVPLGADRVVRVPWTIPAAVPAEGMRGLGFTVQLTADPVASSDRAEIPSLGGADLYGELQLRADLEMTLTDSSGQPLAGVAYELRDAAGEVIDGGAGQSAADGSIRVSDVIGQEYVLVLGDVTLLDATEPEAVPTTPSPENTVLTFVDVRLDAPGEE